MEYQPLALTSGPFWIRISVIYGGPLSLSGQVCIVHSSSVFAASCNDLSKVLIRCGQTNSCINSSDYIAAAILWPAGRYTLSSYVHHILEYACTAVTFCTKCTPQPCQASTADRVSRMPRWSRVSIVLTPFCQRQHRYVYISAAYERC